MAETHDRGRSWRRLAAGAILIGLVGTGRGTAPAQDDAEVPRPPPKAGPAAASELLERLGNAWFARDFEAYLALWEFASPEQREEEEAAAREAFAAEETQLTVLGRSRHPDVPLRLSADVQIFTSTEPEARVQYWRLHLEPRGTRWAIVGREEGGGMDGLIHLPLDPVAWRVRDASLRLEDFELLMEDGSLFHTLDSLGPTALVFVGRGRVRVSPRPPGEREQLRQFAGDPELDREVDWAFVRLHPADLHRVLDVTRLEPDPHAARRRAEAEKRWREHAPRSFLLDAALPRSPWWLSPPLGDAVVDFPWKGSRVLTYALAGNEPEDVNLFDRDHGLRICSYPSGGRLPLYSEDDGREVDVLRHDLVVRFDPDQYALSAVATLRLRLLAPVTSVRLKLDDDLRVSSVTAETGRSLLFFRVREQGSLVVSLGPLAGQADELTLTVRYSGRHDPAPIDQELLQIYREPEPLAVERGLLRPPLVYSNRTAWYPRPGNEDFAPLHARFDVPDGMLAVTGGELVSTRTDEGRVLAEYELQQPGKYFTALVGRLENVGMSQIGEQQVRGFADSRSSGEVREAMEKALELLAFYAERFGPCPYPRMSVAIAQASLPSGHSPPGLAYLQQRPVMFMGPYMAEDPAYFADLPDFFLAHELAHQWWGQGTAPANYREQWLSEAWAQYSAAMWVRHRGGEDDFLKMLDRMARWARRHDEDGAIHLGQRLGHLKQDRRVFRAIVYDKGAWVLHMLRGLVGDEAFFKAARLFLERHRYGKAGTEDFRAALEEASGLDLRPYFERWVYGTGLPTLLWSTQTEETPEGYRTTVQVQPQDLPGPLPLEIAATTRLSRETLPVMLDPEGGSWTIETVDEPRRIEVNEDRGILAETRKVRRLPRRTQR